MKQITLNYDPDTGNLNTPDGLYLATYAGLDLSHPHLFGGIKSDVEVLVKLKNAGFSADEIVELKRKELI